MIYLYEYNLKNENTVSKYYNEYYTLGALYVDFYRDYKMYLYVIVFLITSIY